jgi:hypothetical protein
VSNGDLTISGRTATIDTTGAGGSPATPKDTIQFNSDPAGTFTSDTFFKMSVIGGDGTTAIQAGNMILGGNKIAANTTDQSVSVICDGTGEVFLNSAADAGGTYTNSVVNIMCNANTNQAQLKYRDQTNTDNATITLDGSGDLVLSNSVATKDIDLKVLTTGQVEVANQTTDTDTVLSIMGNGTGAPRLDMQNASKRVWIECQTNKKLTVQGGSGGDTFVFDVSSATGGITFPDSTTQITAASGGGGDGMLFCAAPPASDYDYDLSGQSQGSQGNNLSLSADTLYMMPFTIPTAISADNLTFSIASGTFSGTFYVAIYSSDSNNLPASLQDSASASISTTGDKTITFSSAVSLSADTLYYACISWDGASGAPMYAGGYYEYGRSGLPVDNTTAVSTNSGGVITYAAAGTPPATITTASLETGVRGGPKIRLGV